MPGAVATNLARHYDPEVLKQALGMAEWPFAFERDQHLPDSATEQLQARMSNLLCSPDDVARTVLFAVTQPINVNIAELVVRPPVAISL
jgi:NADP-dependent 3-hydroxy acid dehydrogenase YdfG